MWKQLLSDEQRRNRLARDAAHALVFLIGCAFEVAALLTHDLGLAAAGTTLFGLVGIARA